MKTTYLVSSVIAALVSMLLLIHLIGEQSQCSDDRQCNFYKDIRGCIATSSFALATIARTSILAPLTRLQEKQQLSSLYLNSTLESIDIIAESMEEFSHKVWEDVARKANVWNDASARSYYQPPSIDLNISVPCDYESCKKYLLHGFLEGEWIDNNEWCQLRDVITRDMLVHYASAQFDSNFDLATHPIILRNVLPMESFEDGSRRLTPAGILNDTALSNILLPNYFHDAAEIGYDALVPKSKEITLSRFLRNIQSGEAPRSKIGTQVIIEKHPELREEIFNSTLAKELFSWREDPREYLQRWIGSHWLSWLPPTSYYPVFIADNKPDSAQSLSYPRTDLHAEPIGNIAVQLHGTRRWTLVATKWSKLLRPTVSKHGRAYVYSNMDPRQELQKRLTSLPQVYDCVTNKGDALWVPPWMWHRVDYSYSTVDTELDVEDTLSLGASIFHFYPKLFLQSPLFSFLVIPNLIWEVLGINIE